MNKITIKLSDERLKSLDFMGKETRLSRSEILTIALNDILRTHSDQRKNK